jgi:hypothetical protein
MVKFPRRPDVTVISEVIPLYYIAQNKNGFWLAREAEGRNGGLFLLKRSALRHARGNSKPSGCATMVLNGPIELDVPNQGSRLVAAVAATIDACERRVPTFVVFVRMTAAEWRKLVAEISHAVSGKRRHRTAIDRELICGQYALDSKNDDDLPIP